MKAKIIDINEYRRKKYLKSIKDWIKKAKKSGMKVKKYKDRIFLLGKTKQQHKIEYTKIGNPDKFEE